MEAQFGTNEKGDSGFYIKDGEQQVGEMKVSIEAGLLTAYHTEVSPEAEGKGLGKQLFHAMVQYAREHHLKVKPTNR